jgi:hypothetical protein
VLVGVRVTEHEGFDRIVLEFTGTGVPGWAATYVDRAVLDGSGEAVTLGGGAIPFRISALTDPSRLVVDVVDESAT